MYLVRWNSNKFAGKEIDDFEVKFAEPFRKISDLEKNMHGVSRMANL